MVVVKRWVWVLCLFTLAQRLMVCFRDLTYLDRLFVPDDTYYTLSVARSLAHHLGPSADGLTPTNGFQPLLAFLLVPVSWLTSNLDAPLRTALIIGGVSDALCVVVIARLAERMAGARAALWAGALLAVSPLFLMNALSGLETSLAVLLSLSLVEVACRARELGGLHRYAQMGVLSGLCLLARVDTVFLVLGLFGFEVLKRTTWRNLGAFALTMGLLVAPWWSYEFVKFGSIVPESGPAVHSLLDIHHAIYLDLGKQLAWAAGSILFWPLFDCPSLREMLFVHSDWGWLMFVAILIIAYFAARRLVRFDRDQGPIGVYALHCLALLLFYALYLPALWFFRRYLLPMCALNALLIASALARADLAGPRRALNWAATVVVGTAMVIALISSLRLGFARPTGTVDIQFHGAKGYRDAARQVLSLVPAGEKLAAFQSGALSYYANQRGRVLNLDGVVDGNAYRAGLDDRLSDLLAQRGVKYLADWQFNIENFVRQSQQATIRPKNLKVIGAAQPQGTDRFLVVEIAWN